ncbi:MAG TPA: serine hydrolase domain-containing protein [Acidobacteriota bacterium]|nr:serine hydrolase domain-containing protein [Acidobacteriota bacterium]
MSTDLLPLDFEPGTKTQHSNIGFEVAGALIEKVSGMDYFTYIREKVYRPAGMSDTDSYDRDSPVSFRPFFARDLRNGYTVIVLTNLDNPAAIELGNEIIRLLGLE